MISMKDAIRNDQNVRIESTLGFNRETVSFTNEEDFAVWDVGGCHVSSADQPCEFFGTGLNTGIKHFLHSVKFQGIIWMVNVSTDIEYILSSKTALHQLLHNYQAYIRDTRLLIVYNRLPNLEHIHQNEQDL